MRLLQYDLSDVGVADIRQLLPGATSIASAEPVLSLFVREVDREGPLPQIHMSQGMFRALAFVIHINLAKFSKRKALVLVDDVGEGLDYQRSSSIINFLMGAASEFGLQVIMTSNDQFVMNNVPLENWMILRRKGGRVHAYSEKNSAKDFAEFRYMGLNNFELFASSAFE